MEQNLTETDIANADEIAGAFGETREEIIAEATEAADGDGLTVSEELTAAAETVEVMEDLGLL